MFGFRIEPTDNTTDKDIVFRAVDFGMEGADFSSRAEAPAVAPGRHSVEIPRSMPVRTSKKPGSLMPGVPASLIKAMSSSFFKMRSLM